MTAVELDHVQMAAQPKAVPRALTVLKRDGRRLPFDHTRIRGALEKAFVEVHGGLPPLAELTLTDLLARIDGELA